MCYEQKQSNVMHKFYSPSEHNVQVLKMHHKTRQWMIKKHDVKHYDRKTIIVSINTSHFCTEEINNCYRLFCNDLI